MSKIIEITLDKIIDFEKSKTNNSQFTKTFINSHKGKIPVYGASLIESEVSYGYVADSLEGIRYFDDCLTWNIDGSTAIFYRKGHFSLSEKVIPLIPFDDVLPYIDLEYLKYAILFSQDFQSFNFSHKAGKGKLKTLSILLPIQDDGTYDKDEQQRLAGIYSDIENQKQKLLNRVGEIRELLIHIDREEGIAYKDVPLNKIVEHNNGSASYTKTWCQSHKGKYALYSANNFEPIDYINTYDYDGKYLTYSKNGCAGYITIIDGKFSVNGDRCVLTINDEYINALDILYLKYFLAPIFRKNKKGRLGILGKNEFTKLNSSMIKKLDIKVPIPLDKDGNFDLERQIEIANKYRQIDEIKHGLIDKINYLTSISILPETTER